MNWGAVVQDGFDRTKSLQELEQHDWGEPTYDSYLVTTIHSLRRKPLNQFAVEDLRIMIGQKIGLPFLLPLAVEHLEAEPLVAGDLYPGDLLSAVVGVDEAFWLEHRSLLERIRKIVDRLRAGVPLSDDFDSETVRKLLDWLPRALAR